MGAAIEVFEGARTIEVGRDRFVPVKTTNDLLVLRSDVYDLGHRLRARPGRRRRCRSSTSTSDFYKLVGEFDKRFPDGRAVAAARPSRSRSTATGPSAAGVAGRRRRRARRAGGARARRGRHALRARVGGMAVRPHADRPAEHRRRAPSSAILAAIEPLPPYDQPLLEALGPRRRRGRRRADATCRASTTPAMDGYAVVPRRRRRRHRATTPVHLPVVGEIGGRPGHAAARCRPAPRSDHDRRPGARRAPTRSCPSSGPTAASRSVRITQAPELGQHVRPARRGRREPATCCSRRARCSARASSGCSPRSAAPRCGPARARGSW